MTTTLGCIYGLGMLFFTIAFLVEWIKFRKLIKKYLYYGVFFGVIVVGLDLLIVAITPSVWNPSTFIALITEPIVLIRLIGFTMLGMYYTAFLGYPSFPILLQKYKPLPIEENFHTGIPEPITNPVVEDAPAVLKSDDLNDLLPAEGISHIDTHSAPVSDVLININWKDYFIKVTGISVLSILYSSLLFLLTSPHPSELLEQTFGSSSPETGNVITIQNILVLLEFAVAEEIVFRLGIQNFLVKHLKLQNSNYWIAIFITSGLWTLGHAGVLEPGWVKLAQIFPVGLLLGWLFKKYGTESTMLVHAIFNVGMVLLSPLIMK